MIGTPWAEQYDWTDVAVALTKRLWADGRSASYIADELFDGTRGPSRSAVIGKMHRLGLSGRKPTEPRKSRPRIYAARPVKTKAPPKLKLTVSPQMPWEGSLNIQLLDLKDHQCRYTFTDNPPFLFCGQPTKTLDSSWCEHCYRIVFERPRTNIVKARRVASSVFSSAHR